MSKNPYDVLRDTELDVEEDRPPGDTTQSTAWGGGISSTSRNSSKTSSVTGHRSKQKKARKNATTEVMDLDIEIANTNSQATKSSEENSTGPSCTAQFILQAPKMRPFMGPFGRNPGQGGGLSQSHHLTSSVPVQNNSSSLSSAMRAAGALLWIVLKSIFSNSLLEHPQVVHKCH
jgi:hypothetical protein